MTFIRCSECERKADSSLIWQKLPKKFSRTIIEVYCFRGDPGTPRRIKQAQRFKFTPVTTPTHQPRRILRFRQKMKAQSGVKFIRKLCQKTVPPAREEYSLVFIFRVVIKRLDYNGSNFAVS